MVERKVYVYDKDIQTLQKMQVDVEERVSQHSKIPDAPLNSRGHYCSGEYSKMRMIPN